VASLLAAGIRGSYLAVLAGFAGAAGCRSPLPPPVPEAAAFAAMSAAELGAAAARTMPSGSELVSVRWRFRDAEQGVSGQGAVRVTPPDSLRVDVRGPLGFGRGTLVLAGASGWADPESLVRQVLPSRFLLWAMLGVVQVPDSVERFERSGEGARTWLRVVESGTVVTTFDLRGDALAGVVRMRGDRMVGLLVLARDAAGRVTHARADDLERNVRLDFDIDSRTATGAFPVEVWRHP
jgi:hypothetical protein